MCTHAHKAIPSRANCAPTCSYASALYAEDARSVCGGTCGVAVWRPVVPVGYVKLGDVLGEVRGGAPTQQAAALAINSGLVAFPVGFELVWVHDGGGGSGSDDSGEDDTGGGGGGGGARALWRPIAPKGYAALGCVASVGAPGQEPAPPPVRSVGCVHANALVDASRGAAYALPPGGRLCGSAAQEATRTGGTASGDAVARESEGVDGADDGGAEWAREGEAGRVDGADGWGATTAMPALAWSALNAAGTFDVCAAGGGAAGCVESVGWHGPLDLRSPLGIPPAALTDEAQLHALQAPHGGGGGGGSGSGGGGEPEPALNAAARDGAPAASSPPRAPSVGASAPTPSTRAAPLCELAQRQYLASRARALGVLAHNRGVAHAIEFTRLW